MLEKQVKESQSRVASHHFPRRGMGRDNELVAVVERPQGQRTMEDFWRPIIREEYFAVKQLTIEANNFELKPTLITMVQQHQLLDIQVRIQMSTWGGS